LLPTRRTPQASQPGRSAPNIYLTFAGSGNLFDVDEFTFVKS